ncbi:hypothetical protein M9H77_27211 [Catharanthus roseus]|uniref:Uncharacterized protein n=1 Tax=Catharanthus roseus TaxID=4058 RepID=A0ACC0AG53_CATRO|nr:hypothetical protein M9H77_27211 [Catharanthus roseus]
MTEELKPNSHQNCKRTPSSGNIASRHRKKHRTPEQREESSSGAAELEGNQRSKRLYRKRSSNSNKKMEECGSPTNGPGDQPEPPRHLLTQSRK